MSQTIQQLLAAGNISTPLKNIALQALAGNRISADDALLLFEQGEVGFLGSLANAIKESKHGKKVFFNRNFHIEPTNVCVFSCAFCSYSRLYKNREQGWELSINDMLNIVKKYDGQPVTEVHIVGGVHPKI